MDNGWFYIITRSVHHDFLSTFNWSTPSCDIITCTMQRHANMNVFTEHIWFCSRFFLFCCFLFWITANQVFGLIYGMAPSFRGVWANGQSFHRHLIVCFKILARTENFRYTVSSDVHVNLEGWEFVSTYCICFSKDYYMYFSMESEFVNQKAINNKSLL